MTKETRRGRAVKPNLVSVCEDVLSELQDMGWTPTLAPESYEAIAQLGFRRKTLPLAFVATEILFDEQPITLRGLFYRCVSVGVLSSTDRALYHRLGRLMGTLREGGVVPFDWIVDHIRQTMKPSSWSGLGDFTDTVREAYRRNFWFELPHYVHIFVEKDAIAGVVHPVTAEYDVPLSVVRGFVSLSFAHEIAELWSQIEKPIYVYYVGDFDPSGLALEDDLRDKLVRYIKPSSDAPVSLSFPYWFHWQRLAVEPADFEPFDLRPLIPKASDTRTRQFLARGYTQCAEVDAIPANELRTRVRNAIESHIPQDEWTRLRGIEAIERAQWHAVLAKMGSVSAS